MHAYYKQPALLLLTCSLAASLALPVGMVKAQQVPEAEVLPEPSYYKPIRFETVTQADGLSQTTVEAILQDYQGYLWFATQGGLDRYDGYEIKAYKSNPRDTTTLASNPSSLYEDRSGTLWVGTQWGLHRLDRETDTFTRLPYDLTDSISVGGYIETILEDSAGILWVGTRSRGLRRIDRETNTFTAYWHDPDDPASLSHDRVRVIHEDQAGRLWVGTDAGLDLLDRETGTFTRTLQVAPADDLRAAVLCIREAPSRPDVLWLCTPGGLLAYDVHAATYTRYLDDTLGGQPVPVLGLAPDPDNPAIFWVVTGNLGSSFGRGDGLVRFDTRTGEHLRYRHNPGDPKSLVSNHLISIYTDRSGIVWVGDAETGVTRFDPSPAGFLHYRHVPGDAESLPAGAAWWMNEDHDGGLWAVSSGAVQGASGQLIRIDRQSGKVKPFVHDPADPFSISPGRAGRIFVDERGSVWVLIRGSGLDRIDPKTGRVRHYPDALSPDPDDPSNLGFDRLNHLWLIRQDREGYLWIRRDNRIITRFDPSSGISTPYWHDPSDSTTLSSDVVSGRGVVIGDDGTVWVGTANGLNRFDSATETFTRYYRHHGDSTVLWGLYEGPSGYLWGMAWDGRDNALFRFDPATTSWDTFSHDPSRPDSSFLLGGTFVNMLERPQEPGVLWFASHGGLSRIDAATGQVRHYTESDGFADLFIYGLLEDHAGRLWISTNGGLTVFDPDTGEVRNYDQADGLQANEFNAQSFFQNPRTGEMFFGGINGIAAFFPDHILDNPVAPTVALTDFRVFNKPVEPGPEAPLDKPVAYADEIHLAHWQHSIVLDYVGLHFQNPKKNQYRYRLDGFDEEWIEAGTQRTATYTNLAPGDYTFRVLASNSDGVWSEEAASVRIVVAPPWWRTLWAYALYALLLVGGVFGAYRWQRARLLRQAEIEKARLRAEAAEMQAQAAESQVQAVEAEARALEAENARKRNVELLSEIGKELTASLDIDAIFETLYDHVSELMPTDSFGVGLYDEEQGVIDYRLAIERGTRYAPYRRDASDPDQFPVWCLTHREPVFVNDVAQEYSRYLTKYEDPRRELEDGTLSQEPQSLMYLPLMVQDRVLGVITVQSYAKGAYTEEDLTVLQTLAAYTSVALDNASAYRQLGSTLEDLRATQAQLVQSEKLASLGQLTSGIAHELKNPLNFVNNFAEVNTELADELRAELRANRDRSVEEVADGLEEIAMGLKTNAVQIAKHGRRADAIVQSMMDHARGGTGERYEVGLNAFVDESLNLSYQGLKAQVPGLKAEIERDYGEMVGNVEMAPQEIGRALLNVLNNAFEAVHHRSQSGDGSYTPTVRVSTKQENGQVEIRVCDNGGGIPMEIKEKIFEPFFTTKPTGQGTGLGLSLSYDIVTQGHGGTLTVESIEGEGATFVITLPNSLS